MSRFTASSSNPDVAEPGSEDVHPQRDPVGERLGTTAGRSTSGNDGKLYVAVGRRATTRTTRSRSATLSGKLLRINADGTIPLDNPFYGSTTGQQPGDLALGLRNPFTFDIQVAARLR